MSWRKDRKPLLFNSDYTAKPAYYSIIDGLTTENAIKDVIELSNNDIVSIYGTYNAVVIKAITNGSIKVFDISGKYVGTLNYNEGITSFVLPRGIYIAEKRMFVVR